MSFDSQNRQSIAVIVLARQCRPQHFVVFVGSSFAVNSRKEGSGVAFGKEGGVAMYQRTVKLSNDERRTLIEHRNHDPRPDVRERCAAVLKVADGQSPHSVALTGLLRPRDPDTVYEWLNNFEHQGIEGLIGGRQGGSRPRPFRAARRGVGAAASWSRRRSSPRVGAHARRAAAESLDAADHSSHV